MKMNFLIKTNLWLRLKPSLVLSFLICFSFQSFALSKEESNISKSYVRNEEADQIIIKGKVTSAEDNLGIPGANVTIKGVKGGVTTDFDGSYTITVSSPDVILVFSSVGLKTKEIRVDAQRIINVTLENDVAALKEVIVVAYGTQKKITSTGSIETVTAKSLQDRAVTNPALSLQGQTPGLVVTRNSSRPGREGLNLQIRGATSINGGSPLIVIDGNPAINNEAFYNMNPDDIQSVTVLKDASAALYGSRASNGVIMVTTKKGKNGKMKVELATTTRVNVLGIRPQTPTMQQYATAWLDAAEQDGAQANYWGWQSKENLELMKTGYAGIYPTQFWGNIYISNSPRYEEMFGRSVSTYHNGSISGGTDNTNYRVSYGYSEDVGALQTAYDGKKQYNVRLNYDYNVNKWLKLETNISYFKYDLSSPSSGMDGSVSQDPPFFPSRNPFGQWYANFNIAGNRNNVAATVDGGRDKTTRDQIMMNVAATFKLYDGLTFQTKVAYNKDFFNNLNYVITVPQYSWYGTLAPESVNSESSIRQENKQITYQNYGGFLNYDKSFGNHSFAALLGMTAEKTEDVRLYGYRKGFIDNGVYDINMGSIENKVEATGGRGHKGLYSYLGRFNYAYKNKYLFEGSGRRDGSSQFGPGNKWNNFGGIQAGWVVSEEGFMKNIKPLSHLKLRYSYGEMGSQSGVGNYSYISNISNGSAVFGTTAAQQASSWVNGITSNQNSWERVVMKTYGADFNFFDTKLFGSYDFFTKKNVGMLTDIIYPDVLGGLAPKTNAGELETKGWEVSLGYRGEIGKLKYSVSANMGDTRNILLKKENAEVITPGVNYNGVLGHPLNPVFLYQTALFQTQAEVDAYYANTNNNGALPSGLNVLRPGDTKRVDLNNDGMIDAKDLKFMGDTAAHYVYGVNLSATYGKFDVSTFFQGVLEQNVLRTGFLSYPFNTIYGSQTTAYLGKTWTPENTDAAYPRLTTNTTRAAWNWENNDFALQNNRYIRLKSLIVGYTLKDLKIAQFQLDKFRVYFSGNDLFEFSKVKDGYDPEFGDSSNNIYPFTRTFSLGLNVSF
ncbi:SusC/RagA family TonB-linked outer membrane protein [Flavobacterium cheongpyeongense]|uniref:SusC/RagA family TonB-linked outer membrane protein n=1 Tax=Flavobacterium cheongpyeongense TaxID=2212651 RepID=A0A2V4BYZ4_9FLAO|nr:TonB-dependent receptor [Flavobacterium cheongpyeongense]PXY39214.1 SusC/RagA family TonB-linked outer membrane protein [Flavobacterium cheongpyeongense]